MNTLYMDMDGVVADFDEYAYRTLGIPPAEGIYPEHIWQKLASNPRIYRDLIKTNYSDLLVAKCQEFSIKHSYNLLFLTAVPKGNDVHYAFYDKVNWANQYFPGIPVHFGPYSKDKHLHCKPKDILIDDRKSNILEWLSAGGIAIHHRNINETIEKLSNLQI